MEIRIGEKVSGVVKEIEENGYTVALCNDINGFVPQDNLKKGVEPSNLHEGSEVKVRVDQKNEDGVYQLTLIKLFPENKFQKKPDKYLKNVTTEKKNGRKKSSDPKISEKFEEWVTEIDRVFDKIKKHRKERLNEDFWTI